MTPSSLASSERWAREALRLYRRYQIEIVEACGLCPWAERARLDGNVRELPLLGSDGSIDESVRAISAWKFDERVEVALLIYPRLAVTRSEFDAFVGRVRDADVEKHALGQIPFASAAFHPDAAPDMSHPERLIPFLRRTPDPTIQLVRSTVLERVRDGAPQGTQFFDARTFDSAAMAPQSPPLRERIARANLASTQRMGITELTRRLDDIRRDRNETYEALAAWVA